MLELMPLTVSMPLLDHIESRLNIALKLCTTLRTISDTNTSIVIRNRLDYIRIWIKFHRDMGASRSEISYISTLLDNLISQMFTFYHC